MEDMYRKANRVYSHPVLKNITYRNGAPYTCCMQSGIATSLHHTMFELVVRYLGDDKQVEMWLPKILKAQIIGSYS